jgi:hypothetical protein
MGLLIDSFWRAVGYCLIPRVVALSLLPLLLIAVVAAAGGYFLWSPAVVWVQSALENASWLSMLWGWLGGFGVSNLPAALAPVLVVLGAMPLIVIVCVLAVSMLMTPAMVALVARRRFADLERKRGGSFMTSVLWFLWTTVAALLALVVSVPLWLVPPLVLILPPLIWSWLTYRVMAFDALAEHASKDERQTLFKRHQLSLLLMGVLSGLLGAAPGIVWASGVVFAAAFFVLIPAAIWIYTLVFTFSSLWFTHFCLSALRQLRLESGETVPAPTQTPPPLLDGPSSPP